MARGWLATIALTVAGVARAQVPSLSDDFETGTLLLSDTPAGHWDLVGNPVTQVTIASTIDAGHRGTRGLHVHDPIGGGGVNKQGDVERGFPNASGDAYLRSWIRFDNVGSPDFGTLLVFSGNTSLGTVAEAKLLASTMQYNGFTLGGTFRNQVFPSPDAGTWFLFELAATGIGTIDGGLRAFVDGRLAGPTVAIDWLGVVVNQVSAGAVYGINSYVGDFGFDDVRVGPSPLASTLVVSAAASAAVGACVPVQVELRASTGDPAAAPYDVAAAIHVDGGTPFADSACAAPTSVALISAGATSGLAYVRPASAGDVAVSATHVDFMPGAATLTALGSYGPLELVVCGCSTRGEPAASALTMLAMIGLGLALRRATGTARGR